MHHFQMGPHTGRLQHSPKSLISWRKKYLSPFPIPFDACSTLVNFLPLAKFHVGAYDVLCHTRKNPELDCGVGVRCWGLDLKRGACIMCPRLSLDKATKKKTKKNKS